MSAWSAPATVAGLATDTVSGNPPPTAFLITLWVLTILALGGAIAAVLGAIRLRRTAARMPEGKEQTGKRGQSGCLLIFAVPTTLLGLFLLTWAIGVM